ncbi:MAG: hypothetical protein WCE26_25540 [Candidatus Acidiferrales bacterium]
MEDMIQYIEDFVEPTIADFQRNPTSVRHAFLAAVAVFHAIDYLAYPMNRPADLRQKFRRESADFTMVDDVAHAFKHVSVGNRAKPHLKAQEVVARPPAYFDVSGAFDVSRFDDPVGGVMLINNRQVDLLSVLRSAVTFLLGQNPRGPAAARSRRQPAQG